MVKFYKVLILLIAFSILFFSCSKKDLPAPFKDNSITDFEGSDSLLLSCDSLFLNKVISSKYIQGYKGFSVSGSLYNYTSQLQINIDHSKSSNEFIILLPPYDNFLGERKYQLINVANPSSYVATLTHRFGTYPNYQNFQAQGGMLYVTYLKEKLLISFCNIKVVFENSHHFISGKVEVYK